MKKLLLAMAMALVIPFAAVADNHECPMPEGCDWRTKLVMTIEDEQGENWQMTFMGPRQSFDKNMQHNYLLLEHVYGRDPGAPVTDMQEIINELMAQ